MRVGILATLFTFLFIHDPARLQHCVRRALGDIDWSGIALLIVGVGSLQLVLEHGERED